MSVELSEQEIIRRKKLQDLLDLGINPYPAATYEVNATTAEILENYPKDNSLYQEVSIAGRIMSQRIMGAVSFYVLQDAVGKIQVYATKFVPARTRRCTTTCSRNWTSATSSA